MKTEFIIQDSSIKFDRPSNILEEGLLYTGETWVKRLEKAKKYPDITAAINDAKALQLELPVRILTIQINGNNIGVGIVSF